MTLLFRKRFVVIILINKYLVVTESPFFLPQGNHEKLMTTLPIGPKGHFLGVGGQFEKFGTV